MSEGLKIATLGGLKILVADEPVTGRASRKTEALLVYLACNQRAYVREVLADLLWDNRSQRQALANLRVALTSLRKHFGAYVTISRETVCMSPGADVSLDVAKLEAGLQPWVEAGGLVTPPLATGVVETLGLYRGEFLEGFYLREASGFEAWLVRERERLHHKALDALASLVDYELHTGAYPSGAAHARRLLELDPLMESAQRQLMLLLNYSGQRGAALEGYERFRKLLAEELSVEPEMGTQALYAQIQAGELGRPVLRETIAPVHNLPSELTSFIGRQCEMAEIERLLTGDHGTQSQPNRLVTLIGAGGCGKTRLSIRTASGVLEAYAHGAWLVELASLNDPTLVPQAALRALSLRVADERSALEVLVDHLRAKHLLLVVDNCEHLIGACAEFIESLLRSCPRLSVLATSREVLGVPGETVFNVPPLSTPDMDQPLNVEQAYHYEAVQLFVERAADSLPGFVMRDENAATIARICRRLDGIPLAIELAAARVNVLSLAGIAARLDDRFGLLTRGSRTALPRHQTLRATIDWSYDLLAEKERVLLRRLSIFAGDWSLDATETICKGEDIAEFEILELLSGLVNKSMVVATGAPDGDIRYSMLETIRQYGCEKLQEAGEQDWVSQRHLDYYLRFAETSDRELRGPTSLEWTRRLERDYDNLRAALMWSLGTSQAVEQGVQLANSLHWCWDRLGYWHEARFWLERTLVQSQALGRTADRAKALCSHGVLSYTILGDWTKGQILLEESLDICRELGSACRMEYAYTLVWLGFLLGSRGDRKTGLEYLQEARDIFQDVGDQWGQAWALNLMSGLVLDAGDRETACKLCEEGAALFRETGDRWGLAILLQGLGDVSLLQGDYSAASKYLQESLEILRDFGSVGWAAHTLNDLGEVARCLNEYDRAQEFYLESLSIYQQYGFGSAYLAQVAKNLAYVALYQGDKIQAVSRFKEALKLSQELESKYLSILCLAGFAAVAADRGKAEVAICLYGTVAFQIEGLQAARKLVLPMIDPADRLEFERYQATCRARLDEDATALAWEEGRKMDLDQAIELALQKAG